MALRVDGDIDDAGTDNLVVDDGFGSTNVTVSHCNAGNLIDDGHLVFIYDAWHRLVAVRLSEDSHVVLQTASFDEVSFTYDDPNDDFGSGMSGLFSNKTDVTFDNFTAKPTTV